MCEELWRLCLEAPGAVLAQKFSGSIATSASSSPSPFYPFFKNGSEGEGERELSDDKLP